MEKRADIPFQVPTRWSTDAAATARTLEYWTTAENVIYESSKATRKWGGTSRLNSAAISGTPSVMGLFDAWFSGTSGSMTGYPVAHAGTALYKMDRTGAVPDGTWDDITGSLTLTSGAFPTYAMLRDNLVMTTWAATPDAPHVWTGTGNASALGGTPPVGRVCCMHANRMWIANTNANPSRLYYSASLNVADWSSGDTGSFDIDPDDGDRIIGLASHYKRLFIFKGPYRGSIHMIVGTSPTDATDATESFRRQLVVRGLPLASQRSIVPVGNDLWFVTHRGVHSLANTQNFGDHVLGFLTNDITNYWRDTINGIRLDQAAGAYYTDRNLVVFSLCETGQSNNTGGLIFHPQLGNTISRLTRGAASLATFYSTGGKHLLYAGRYSNGFVDLEDAAARQLAGAVAYTAKLRTPTLLLAPGDGRFTMREMYLRMRPRGGAVTVNVTRDTNAAQSLSFTQTAGGSVLDTGVLDAFNLGEVGGFGVPARQFIEGPARAVMVEISQGTVGGDLELLEFGLKVEKADDRMESP